MRQELLLLNSDFNKRRINSLQQMLMELSVGNFYFRVEPTGWDDPLEALGVMANMMAEELEASFLPKDYKDRYVAHDPISRTVLILDEKLYIRRFHPKIITLLDRKVGQIQDRPMAELLDDKSHTALKGIETLLVKNKTIDVTVKMTFKTGKGLLLPIHAKLFSLSGQKASSGKTLMMTFQNKKTEKDPEQEEEKRVPLHYTDARNLRRVRNYIWGHVEEPLPSLKSLAHTFGINESKLKQGFKQLYGCTVFEYYRKTQLKRAKILIENTELLLKNISEMVGFKSLSHFSKAFRNYYGFAPSMLKNPSKPKG